MDMKFVRLARGLENQVSTLIPATDSIFDIVKKNPRKDLYISLYHYQDHHLEQFNKTKSVAGIRDVTTNKILFDFDSASDIEAARRDAITVCDRLISNDVAEDNIRCWFSGAKGFGVEVLTDQDMSRQEFVNVVFNLAGDLETFDTRINDEARVIRAPLSQHPKSKLHKIPLLLSELKETSIDNIKRDAVTVEGYDAKDFVDESYIIPMPEKLNALRHKEYKKISSVIESKDIKGFDIKDINLDNCPTWLDTARYILSEGYFYGSGNVAKGERNAAFMILAATFKNQGFSAEHTQALLMVTAEKQAKRTGEDPYTEDQLRREVINSVFSTNWKGGVYGKDEELLQLTRKRFDITDFQEKEAKNLIKIEDVGKRFKNFAANFHENRIFTGITSLDKKLVLTTGMTVGILGSPGSGKTTLLNKIIKFQSEKGIPCIYQSLDMSDNLLYVRMLQQYTKMPIEAILENFQKEKPDQVLLDAYNDVLKSYSNVHFNFRSAMTVDQIDRDIEQYKRDTGLSPKFVAIDYLEKVRSEFTDPTASSGLITSQLSDLAKKHDTCVALLLQPQKSAGDPSQPLLSMRKIKGASQIEQDLRAIITAWRPGFNPQDSTRDKYMSLAVVKNNLGGLCQLDYEWSGLSGEIDELDMAGRSGLKSLLADIEEQRKEERTQPGYDI